jgi:general secretion pathway protein N
MSRKRLLILFGGITALWVFAFFPMKVAFNLMGLDKMGLAARDVRGTIWSGMLVDAHAGAFSLGDVKAALDPLPLVIGRADVRVSGVVGQARVSVSSNALMLSRATGQLALGDLLAPVPISGLALDDAAIGFANARCTKAEGRVRATFSQGPGGLSLAQGMTGTPRCEGEYLVLPLISASAMERLTLRIAQNGRYRGEFVVRPGDPQIAVKLSAAGFTLTQGGVIQRFEGTF